LGHTPGTDNQHAGSVWHDKLLENLQGSGDGGSHSGVLITELGWHGKQVRLR
jgi:hypothetical protein